MLFFLRRDEVLLARVAIVKRGAWVVEHRVRLRAEADDAHEAVEAVHASLRMHDHRAAVFVGATECIEVIALRDRAPTAAVVGLHKERIAELLADLSEVEELRVLRERGLEVGVR